MSTIAPHIQQFAEQYAESIYPYAEMPFSHSDAVRTAAAAIEAWESSKPSKSVFTEIFPGDGTVRNLPDGPRLLWRLGDGTFTVGEAFELLADDATSFLDAYTTLPCDLTSEVL